jgi:hypothetical protein
MLRQTSKFTFLILALGLGSTLSSGCSIFGGIGETPAQIIEKSSQQKIFFAPYDLVWRAAHMAIKYTIANENQDYGVIETDYIKTIDGWVPPDRKIPEHRSGRYKLILTFAKGSTNGRESTRVNIEKKIEIFKDFISDTQTVPSDGLEEQSLFYRIEREIIIAQSLKRAGNAAQ